MARWVYSHSSDANKVNISADALRMRCRRLCEQKPSGKYTIDKETTAAYSEGGASREVLEMGLLECLAKYGTARKARNKIKAIPEPHSDCVHISLYIYIHILQYIYIYIQKNKNNSTYRQITYM